MNEVVDPDGVEWLLSLGIFLLGGGLSALSYLAWRREHDRKLLLVTTAYALFALRGLAVVIGPVIEGSFEIKESNPSIVLALAELFTHLSALLVLVGLVVFFVAFTRS